jgi:hypothetical protein
MASWTSHQQCGRLDGGEKSFRRSTCESHQHGFIRDPAGNLRGEFRRSCGARLPDQGQLHPGWFKTDMGGSNADLEVAEGGKTSAQLAILPADGPTGGYFHLGESLPW